MRLKLSHLQRRIPILVVEDEPAICQLITSILQRDYDVRLCTSGRDALNLLSYWPPRLILCDLNVPEMNGFELITAVRANPALANIPVIVMTGQSTGEYERRALDLGAVAFLAKPFKMASLHRAISQALDAAEQCA